MFSAKHIQTNPYFMDLSTDFLPNKNVSQDFKNTYTAINLYIAALIAALLPNISGIDTGQNVAELCITSVYGFWILPDFGAITGNWRYPIAGLRHTRCCKANRDFAHRPERAISPRSSLDRYKSLTCGIGWPVISLI